MHAISSYVVTDPYTLKHTHTHTNTQDRLQYTASQLAHSVLKLKDTVSQDNCDICIPTVEHITSVHSLCWFTVLNTVALSMHTEDQKFLPFGGETFGHLGLADSLTYSPPHDGLHHVPNL